jgi:hypothetical protein
LQRAADRNHPAVVLNEGIPIPKSLYAFAAVSILAAVLGIAHGYPLQNVAKQFYGCVLFCVYFLFAVKFTGSELEVNSILHWAKRIAIACALAFIVIYLVQVPSKGFRKELTILSAYAGGLSVLYLPECLKPRAGISIRVRAIVPMLILLTVPLFAQYKRAVLAFAICAFLAVGLRSASRNKRYALTAAACFLFTAAIVTDMLSPVGAVFSKYDSLKYLFPEDIQNTYSVYLRFEEVRQVFDSLGGAPVLGTGLGNTIIWYNPYSHELQESETMDMGWAYLIVKMGMVGTAIFVLVIAGLFFGALRTPLHGLHLAVFLLFVYQLLQMIADPFFVYFMTSVWAGMTAGSLHILNQRAKTSFLSVQPAS